MFLKNWLISWFIDQLSWKIATMYMVTKMYSCPMDVSKNVLATCVGHGYTSGFVIIFGCNSLQVCTLIRQLNTNYHTIILNI